MFILFFFFFQAEDGIRDYKVTGVQTCALPISFGRWVGVELTADNRRQLFIPAGFGHGFCATADVAEVEYKCSDLYVADDQHGVIWSDPTIGIAWPVREPILSDSDRAYGPLTLDRDDLPVFAPVRR